MHAAKENWPEVLLGLEVRRWGIRLLSSSQASPGFTADPMPLVLGWQRATVLRSSLPYYYSRKGCEGQSQTAGSGFPLAQTRGRMRLPHEFYLPLAPITRPPEQPGGISFRRPYWSRVSRLWRQSCGTQKPSMQLTDPIAGPCGMMIHSHELCHGIRQSHPPSCGKSKRPNRTRTRQEAILCTGFCPERTWLPSPS